MHVLIAGQGHCCTRQKGMVKRFVLHEPRCMQQHTYTIIHITISSCSPCSCYVEIAIYLMRRTMLLLLGKGHLPFRVALRPKTP
jgi:hypothetical protein